MPPSQKRARRYDPVRTRSAVLAQFAHVREAVRTLTPGQLALPTRLGDWTVRELAAHLTMALSGVTRSLDMPAPAPAKSELTLVEWPASTADRAARIADDTRALAAGHPDLDALYGEVAGRFEEMVPGAGDERLLTTRVGMMRLADFLVTRTVELVVHTDDLNEAAGLDIPYDRQALAACTRLLADALAEKAPGGSVEVRIPPFAVVQCVPGPRHTRGTPPNVVETDPLTWIRLATGRTEWARALDEAKVGASGERADLAALLPLMG
ncbi:MULTISPECIES: maleylpyruvate isomerase family mycothiol-dependent enzyme [unclassified Streptomyces]|uniref:maleylpyruvate isomerase family mycothiol-dependent enzyme n=1 Tax=unclassified Streptomyces TaxID=2593676 RepID=UPI00081B5EE5|nr:MULTISPECIES: maleylpyruvate isomerase family mycothiol-dependent enzyme [unclassified Streptomyces]MYQ88507.1 maleylpyruvate isomerase family mycothiol-dependent enzyme [Streptomyces sp. SID4936]SCE55676.1 TIGR03083 family protein [Streptomyces sp. DvalAA-43]